MWQFNSKFVDYKFLIENFNQTIAIAASHFDSRFSDISTKYARTISWKIVRFPLFFLFAVGLSLGKSDGK